MVCGTGLLPHPATHQDILAWLAGWGSGPVPHPRKRSSNPQKNSFRTLIFTVRPSGSSSAG